MITIGGKEYRNLEEQVLKNMEDIQTLQESVVDITTSDNTFTGVNNFKGNLYKLTESGAPQFAATNVMTAISFYDENDDQTGTVGVTSGGVKIKVNNNVIEVSDTGVGISAPGSGVGIHNVDTPEDGDDAANKSYVDSIVTDTVASYLPLAGGTMKGTLNMGDNAITLGSHTIQNIPANNYLNVSGTVRFLSSTVYGGNLNITGKKITNLGTPTTGTDAANKQYVDDQIATIDTSAYLPTAGGTMTGNIAMGLNEITLNSPSTTHRIYTDPNNNYLFITGTTEFTGNIIAVSGINMFNKKITNLATPTNGTDAANKQYVDSVASAGGSTYNVTVTSNLTNATISKCWKIGKMITLFGKFNDDLNLGANTISVQAGDSIQSGYIQCGDAVMSVSANGEFEEESNSTIQSVVNGRNFTGMLFLS